MIASVAGNIFTIIQNVLLFQWYVGIQFIVCATLGHFVAVKTGRSHLNWILTGLLAGVIPIVGILFMVAALLWYPPPAPRSGPGHQPRRRARDRHNHPSGARRGGR